MLSLTLNGHELPVAEDFSMELTWRSPATSFTRSPSGYGFGISFPITDATRAIFGNPERISKYRKDGQTLKLPGFEVRFSGVLLMAGTISVTADSDSYSATLTDPVGELGEKEQERDILQIDRFGQVMPFENKPVYDPVQDAYCCFPVKNTDFFKDKGFIIEQTRKVQDPEFPNDPTKKVDEQYDTEILTHLFDKTVQSRINEINPDWTIKQFDSLVRLYIKPYEGNVSVVTPFFFLNYVIKEILKDSKLSIGKNYLLEHPALKNLVIYNNYDITPMEFITGGYEYLWMTWHYQGEGNMEDVKTQGNQVLTYNRKKAGATVTAKNHLPKMKVGDLILGTQNLFNVVFHFLPNRVVNIISRDQMLKEKAVDLDAYFLGPWRTGEKKNVALKFTREHDQNDLIFSERYHDLSDRRSDIKGTVANWASLKDLDSRPEEERPKEGDIWFCIQEGVYAEYKWTTQNIEDPYTKKEQNVDILGWEEASIGYQPGWAYYGREEVEEIKSEWSTTHGDMFNAIVKQPGNMKSWQAKKTAFSPRLLFYTPSMGGNQGNNRFVDGVFAHEVSLQYFKEKTPSGDDTSLIPRFWKHTNRFWANRMDITGEFDFSVSILRYLVYNICKKYRTKEGEFLIDEMSCPIYKNHIGVTKVKAFKKD